MGNVKPDPLIKEAVVQYSKATKHQLEEGHLYFKLYIGDGYLNYLIHKTNGVVYDSKGDMYPNKVIGTICTETFEIQFHTKPV